MNFIDSHTHITMQVMSGKTSTVLSGSTAIEFPTKFPLWGTFDVCVGETFDLPWGYSLGHGESLQRIVWTLNVSEALPEETTLNHVIMLFSVVSVLF